MFYRRQITILLLGFSSGLPLALASSTLQAWFAVSHIDIITIGLLSLVGYPYLFKFLWAPVLDRIKVPYFGRRRGWMLLMQIALIVTLLMMALTHVAEQTFSMAMLALLLSFFSATQDIAVDAYRTDILPQKERGIGVAMSVAGYRIAMLISGGLALVLADTIGWHLCYFIMAILMLVGVFATLIAPPLANRIEAPTSLKAAIVKPITSFFQQPFAVAFLFLIFFYKLSEAFTSTNGSMTNVFLLNALHFSLTTVGSVNKIGGLLATLFGVFLGGILLARIRLYSALFIFGILQAVSNLGYAILATVGKNFTLMVTAICLDNICAGLGTAAIIALMMSLCDRRYTATQFALLTAVAAASRIILGPISGYMIKYLGWTQFYLWTFVLALPALAILWWLQHADCFKEPVLMRSTST